ncbi:extracellular solute-binding protein [Chitinibacter bivalviorum]|uniref:Extracellular solute-binding protein n=1 Tax=Chitinibacter bivalviorum TaxID=2739434 RepID=A0A7H9BKX8_9NEIS|nr:extracellular solute-binding protein [Chitinibacter bivalviorum]QLG89042.1 extracellular solute-binding protein [Chitinibacter bivalviorum]
MRRFVAPLLLIFGLSSPPLLAKEVLRVLSWPGYNEPEQVRQFEQRYDVKVEVSYVGADDELWLRGSRNQGRNFDVVAVNTAVLQRFIDHGLAVPIDIKQIPNAKNQLARFQQIPALTRDHNLYAMPYAYSEMGLIYNRQLVKTPPKSIAELWNPAYKNQVLAYDGSAHNFSVAALQLGYKNPFALSQQETVNAVSKLVELRRNVYKFYKTPEEVIEIYQSQPIALIYANYGSQQVNLLKKSGADIGYIIPKEGALAWLDCWAILPGAQNLKLAHAWINFTLSKEMSRQLVEQQGLSNTTQASKTSNPTDKLIWLEPVENAEERASLWTRIVAGHKKDGY